MVSLFDSFGLVFILGVSRTLSTVVPVFFPVSPIWMGLILCHIFFGLWYTVRRASVYSCTVESKRPSKKQRKNSKLNSRSILSMQNKGIRHSILGLSMHFSIPVLYPEPIIMKPIIFSSSVSELRNRNAGSQSIDRTLRNIISSCFRSVDSLIFSLGQKIVRLFWYGSSISNGSIVLSRIHARMWWRV